jgi:LmbE family N-acetylglucosaminyl deacetylase
MNQKEILKQVQNLVPKSWLYPLQDIHSNLLFRWMLHRGSKPLVLNQKSVLVFSPHQDDETFGCGGMIALKRQQGVSVAVAFLTDGQGSHAHDMEQKDKIVQIRKQEAVKALDILGVESTNIHFLEKPDGFLPELPKEQRKKTIEQLAELIKFYKPEEVYVPHRKDCHKDHEATYELVKEAISLVGVEVELLQYPIWLFWRAPLFIILKLQDITNAYKLSIEPVKDKKTQAIACYCSQLKTLPSNFVKRFLDSSEIFFKEHSEY